MTNHYKRLGLGPGVTWKEIKKRSLALGKKRGDSIVKFRVSGE